MLYINIVVRLEVNVVWSRPTLMRRHDGAQRACSRDHRATMMPEPNEVNLARYPIKLTTEASASASSHPS